MKKIVVGAAMLMAISFNAADAQVAGAAAGAGGAGAGGADG